MNLSLVNSHTHAAMIGFRGMAEDLPLEKWWNDYIFPAEKNQVDPSFVYEQTKLAIIEMKKNGISIFMDMYFFEEEVARAAEEMKMKVVIGEGVLDFPTPSCQTSEKAFKKTEELIKKYENNEYVSVSVAPHSIYTVSESNLVKAKELARRYEKIFQIHLSETKKEVDDCLVKNGLTPVAYLESLGILDEKSVLIHCVWLNDEDINIIKKRNCSVIHCPLSNLKLGSGLMPLVKLIENKINVALGTDGAASSNRLDIWEAGKIAGLLQKGLHLDPSVISAKELIKMMSVNGMRALGISEINGLTIPEIEKRIETEDFSYLYHLHAGELF